MVLMSVFSRSGYTGKVTLPPGAQNYNPKKRPLHTTPTKTLSNTRSCAAKYPLTRPYSLSNYTAKRADHPTRDIGGRGAEVRKGQEKEEKEEEAEKEGGQRDQKPWRFRLKMHSGGDGSVKLSANSFPRQWLAVVWGRGVRCGEGAC